MHLNDITVDVIFGASWGDEGKGKISTRLANDYDFICRYNGGANAGHTFYVDDVKIVTHLIPSGIVCNKKSIIGPNCVLNVDDFFKEIEYLNELGFDTSLVKVSPMTHIVTNDHIKIDKEKYALSIGTTSKGIGPCYADKVSRIGVRAEQILDSKWMWDGKLYGNVLCEGAQSFWLDINYGQYPYVTASECLPYSSCSLGFSPKKIRNIIGVAKMYDTRSGIDPYFDVNNEETEMIISCGNEFGSTTGRKRKVKYLNLDKLIFALNTSGATIIYLNKGDVLMESKVFKCYKDNELIEFTNIDTMKQFIKEAIVLNTDVAKIEFDFNP